MPQLSKLVMFLICFALLNGCASTTDLGKYAKLTTAADTYVESYLGVIDLTADVSIENTSLEVIEYHLNTPESQRKGQFFVDATTKFEDSYTQTKNRLTDLGLVREHLSLFGVYFSKLATFAGNQTAQETEAGIKSSAGQINKLVKKITDDDNKELIKDGQITDLSALSNYIFKAKTAKTLEQTIEADIGYLTDNLLLHERVFTTISSIIDTEFGGASELKKRFDLEMPLTAAKPPFTTKREREEWMNSRRRILLTALNTEALTNTSRAATKFREALEAISQDPKSSTAKLDAFLTEVENLKNTVNSLRE